MTDAQKEKERLLKAADNDLLRIEDGDWVYWPSENRGYLKSYHFGYDASEPTLCDGPRVR